MASGFKTNEAYDSALLGILQHEAAVQPFIDVIFSFLSRKTDFYRIMKTKNQSYGFAPGVAEQMVLNSFKKYQKLVEQEEKLLEMTSQKDDLPVDFNRIAHEETVEESTSNVSSASVPKPEPVPNQSKNEPSTSSQTENPSNNLSTLDQTAFQANPDSHNGAIRENYSWSQNYDDVDVKITVPSTISKARQVFVDIKKQHLIVKIKENDDFTTIIDDDLHKEIKISESMWSLESKKSISITLTKVQKFWWTNLVTNEEAIDIQKISAERPMEDVKGEEKAVINKLQFDERQKRLGLPQSHEIKVHEMLKKGWNSEGSPFKGQDFDPKMFNISPGAVQ